METAELADGLESRDAVDLGMDRRRNGVGPEGNRAVLGEERSGGQERKNVGEGLSPSPYAAKSQGLPYWPIVNGTTAAVFSHPIASLPPESDMSTKPIVNWSIDTAGVIIVMGTRTTSNFGS